MSGARFVNDLSESAAVVARDPAAGDLDSVGSPRRVEGMPGAARRSAARCWAPAMTDGSVAGPRVGVLALQGDVREHLRMLALAGGDPVTVRRAADLDGLDGIV